MDDGCWDLGRERHDRKFLAAGPDLRVDTPKRIASIVINSVSHDARVLKEADSLAAAGYSVAVFGIQDNRCSAAKTVRDSGVVICRVNRNSLTLRFSAGLLRLRAVGCLAAGLAALLMLAFGMTERPSGVIGVGIFVAVPWILLSLLGFRRAARASAKADHLAASDVDDISAEDHVDRTVISPDGAVRPNARSGSSPPQPILATRGVAHATRHFTSQSHNAVQAVIARARKRVSKTLLNRAMVDLVLQYHPDAVHCHDLGALPVGWAVKKHLGGPLVYDSHELHDELSLISRFERWSTRVAQHYYSGKLDGFITVNDSIAQTMNERYPKLPPAVVVRNATKYVDGRVEYDGRLHRAAQLADHEKVLLYQGGFSRHRGLDVLVRAAPLLPDGWVLVMMGWGTMESQLRAIASAVDPNGRWIRFVPSAPQEELAHWTAGGSIGVIPYENVCLNHWFCTPNKLWEYPAAGVPILASPFPELRKVVETNDIGLLLSDPPTPQNIAQVVASVTDERLAQMQDNCHRFLRKDNWGVYEQRLVEFYDEMFGTKRSGKSIAMPKTETEVSLTRMSPTTETPQVGGESRGA